MYYNCMPICFSNGGHMIIIESLSYKDPIFSCPSTEDNKVLISLIVGLLNKLDKTRTFEAHGVNDVCCECGEDKC